MNKAVYSLVLSEDVVAKVDKLAYTMGTSRSNLVNQILAEYVSYETPEKRMREVIEYAERMLGGRDSFQVLRSQSAAMLSARSALAFKYNPTVRYSVELTRGGFPELGELRVSLRTQNNTLLLYMTQFYKLWMKVESRYLRDCEYTVDGGRFSRKLRLRGDNITEEIGNQTLGELISAYISAFDSALKAFFYNLNDPERAVAETERAYKLYYGESGGII